MHFKSDTRDAALITAAVTAITFLLYNRAVPSPLVIEMNANSSNAVGLSGFSHAEPWGRWTDGPTALISTDFTLPRKFRLSLDVKGFGPNIGKSMVVAVGSKRFDVALDSDFTSKTIEIEDDSIFRHSIELEIPTPASPHDLGINEDGRKLGAGLKLVRIEAL